MNTASFGFRSIHTTTLADMLDAEGQRWVKSRYKKVREGIDKAERDRKVAKAASMLAVATATADVFGDTHAEQEAKKKAEKSMARTQRYTVPLEDLDIDLVLREMPELYQAYRAHQAEENRRWNPGISGEDCYEKDWFRKSKEKLALARKNFEAEIAYGEKAAAKEDRAEEKLALEALKEELQPSLF